MPLHVRYNEMAIIALVLVFFFWPAAVVFGLIALKQIKTTNERGYGLAMASVILGILFTVLTLALFFLILSLPSSTQYESTPRQNTTPNSSEYRIIDT